MTQVRMTEDMAEDKPAASVRMQMRVMRALSRLLARLSVDTLRRLARVIARLLVRRRARIAQTTQVNVDLVYGDLDAARRQELVTESLAHTASTALETIAFWTWPQQRFYDHVVSVHGGEYLRERRKDRGMILLTPHYGNWELLGIYFGLIEHVVVVYERPKMQAFDILLRQGRARFGNGLAPATTAGLRYVLKTLRGGGLVGLLPDQVPDDSGTVTVPFCGIPVSTMTLVHRLLRGGNVDVVMTSARRVPGGFVVRIQPADADLYDADEAVCARALNRMVEREIEADPAQYQWDYKRFRVHGEPHRYG